MSFRILSVCLEKRDSFTVDWNVMPQAARTAGSEVARCRLPPRHHHCAASNLPDQRESDGGTAENQERLPGNPIRGAGFGCAAKPARENPQRVCVPVSQSRTHQSRQRAEYAPPGAEAGGAALCEVPRSVAPLCQVHDKKIWRFFSTSKSQLRTAIPNWLYQYTLSCYARSFFIFSTISTLLSG